MLTRKGKAIIKPNTFNLKDHTQGLEAVKELPHRLNGVGVMRWSPRKVAEVQEDGDALHHLVWNIADYCWKEHLRVDKDMGRLSVQRVHE